MGNQTMDRLRDTLSRALDQMSSEQLTSTTLDNIYKLVTAIYKIDKIQEESGMSEYSLDGGSFARGRGRYAKRDSMGRYSSEGSNDYSRGYSSRDMSRNFSRDSYRGYSRDGYRGAESSEQMVMDLKQMMEEAPDERTRKAIQHCISQMEG